LFFPWLAAPASLLKEFFMPFQNIPFNQPVREMVGSTAAPFFVGPNGATVSLEIHPAKGPARDNAASGKSRVYLRFENITCQRTAPSLRVFLNLPPGDLPTDHPELRAGSIGLFGIDESSRPDGPHGGQGMTLDIDITNLFRQLMANTHWDAKHLNVTFIPAKWDAPVPQIRIARVSMHLE
jgi:tyrosinase